MQEQEFEASFRLRSMSDVEKLGLSDKWVNGTMPDETRTTVKAIGTVQNKIILNWWNATISAHQMKYIWNG